MSTPTITHHHQAPRAAAAAAVVAIAVGGVALTIARVPAGTVVPSEPGQHALAPPQHGSGHFEPTTSGGRVVVGP